MLADRRGAHRSERDSWNSIRLYHLYRISVATLVLALYLLDALPLSVQHNHHQFLMVAQSMVLINILLLPIVFFKLANFRSLVVLMVIIDIASLTLLMHANANPNSGLELLIIPSIAGASLLLPGTMAPFFAAIATLAIFVETGHGFLVEKLQQDAFTQAAIYGVVFFAVTLVSAQLARRARASEVLALRRGQALENLAEINSHIVESMETGILVVTQNGRIRQMNGAALHLLGLEQGQRGARLAQISLPLQQAQQQWHDNPTLNTQQLHSGQRNGKEFEAVFVRNNNQRQSDTLIYLHDISERSRKLQEIKLAALGRLTASIAHEIRNPLGAISHAAQLLDESEDLNAADERLTQIIHTNSQRMNRLVGDILDISRRDQFQAETIKLHPWLTELIDEFSRHYQLDENAVQLQMSETDSKTRADPNHLQRVVWNLLQNAHSHASPQDRLHIAVQAGTSKDAQLTWLDITDNGERIDAAVEQQLFEPFFTTASDGTGLGLYIARELCASNGGSLEYLPADTGGSCFRIKLPAVA